jgi:hypothetical protein
MAPSLPCALVQRLTEIGLSEHFAELTNLGDLFPETRNGAFMRLRPEVWMQAVVGLPAHELAGLIKALTLVERVPNHKAGSVSPVIWLFRLLPNRSERVELVNWILSHTENDYLPFGSSNHGATSLGDYHRRCQEIAQRVRERKLAEEYRQEAASLRKAEDASRKLLGALRRKDMKAVASLLDRGANPEVKNADGQTALEYAKSVGMEQFLNSVSSNKQGYGTNDD